MVSVVVYPCKGIEPRAPLLESPVLCHPPPVETAFEMPRNGTDLLVWFSNR